MKYFTNCKTLDELKAEYRRLAMANHPDRGGDAETMKQINADHDAAFEILKKRHNESADEFHQTTETAEEFRDIIEALLKLDGLTVELCGCWLWISGNTKEHKEALKAAGCRFPCVQAKMQFPKICVWQTSISLSARKIYGMKKH